MFSFYEVFCEQHHLQSVSKASVLCIYCSWLWKIENARNVHIFLQKLVHLECKIQHAVITHANTSNDIKIPTFFCWKSWGNDVILVQCPFKNALSLNKVFKNKYYYKREIYHLKADFHFPHFRYMKIIGTSHYFFLFTHRSVLAYY